ncbi:MAG: hypothetical protein GY705_23475 [Bacteroidetes bacterium]|nr:hypothetical protein [Bacteroidota bacterium]
MTKVLTIFHYGISLILLAFLLPFSGNSQDEGNNIQLDQTDDSSPILSKSSHLFVKSGILIFMLGQVYASKMSDTPM